MKGINSTLLNASLSILMKRAIGSFREPFSLESFRVIDEKTKDNFSCSQSTIKISVDGEHELPPPRETDLSTLWIMHSEKH